MPYSHSKIQKYKDCPLSFFFEYEAERCGLKKQDDEESEHHLRYGSAGHSALKLLYKGDSLENAKKEFLKEYPVQLDENDMAKTADNGLIMLDRYAAHWREIDKKWRVIECEEKTSFEYLEDSPFTVVLDIVMENIEFGGVYGFDHKIVGGKKAYLSYDFWDRFNPNTQITKYISYIIDKYGECHGFYINAIGLGYRQRAYKGEPAGFWCKFERQMFNRGKEQIEQDKKDTEYWISRIEDSRKTGVYGANTSNCRYCNFKAICQSGWVWEFDKELILVQYDLKNKEEKSV